MFPDRMGNGHTVDESMTPFSGCKFEYFWHVANLNASKHILTTALGAGGSDDGDAKSIGELILYPLDPLVSKHQC